MSIGSRTTRQKCIAFKSWEESFSLLLSPQFKWAARLAALATTRLSVKDCPQPVQPGSWHLGVKHVENLEHHQIDCSAV
jgi:hypothetical protein